MGLLFACSLLVSGLADFEFAQFPFGMSRLIIDRPPNISLERSGRVLCMYVALVTFGVTRSRDLDRWYLQTIVRSFQHSRIRF